MSHRSFAIVSAVLVGGLVMQAQEPPSTRFPFPSDAQLPEPDDSEPPAHILRIFDGTIDGELPELEPTGDLIADELQRVRHERSVLNDFPSEHELGLAPVPGGDVGPEKLASRSARAAEQLLKAARLLENLGSADSDRAELVERMRVEAGKVLAE